MNTIFVRLRDFAETVFLNGGRAFFVGGTVRDRLLGGVPKDVDIEVYGLSGKVLQRVVKNHFKKFDDVGVAFGVLHVRVEDFGVDISMPRLESKVGAGHGGFDVDVVPDLDVEDALRRRDFTVNAILEDILSGEIIDPFGGRLDLNARVLRVVDENSFGEDPLRVLRGVQFVARLGLSVDVETMRIMRGMVGEMGEISIDRQREEWRKLWLKGVRPSLGLQLALDLGVFDELEVVGRAVGTEQERKWHPEGNVWGHVMMVCDEAAVICEREEFSDDVRMAVMLGAFCHDFGKVDVTREIDGVLRAIGHDEAGGVYVAPVLAFFGLSRYLADVRGLVRWHMMPRKWYAGSLGVEGGVDLSDGGLRALARDLWPSTVDLLCFVSEADLLGRENYYVALDENKTPLACSWLRERARRLGVLYGPPADVIRGGDLLKMGFDPGPRFGFVVKAANVLHDSEGFSREEILDLIETRLGSGEVSSVEEVLLLLRG